MMGLGFDYFYPIAWRPLHGKLLSRGPGIFKRKSASGTKLYTFPFFCCCVNYCVHWRGNFFLFAMLNKVQSITHTTD